MKANAVGMTGWHSNIITVMDTYALQRRLLQAELLPTEKLVGMALALHMDKRTGKIRVRQETVAQECGVSVRTVRRAVAALVSSGVFTSTATGRSSVLAAGSGKSTGRVDRPPVSCQTGHRCPHLKRKRAPWEYDLAYSTRPEEEEKRGHERFLREREERRPNGGCDDGGTI